MTTTETAIRRATSSGRTAVLPFICGGYPGPGDTRRTLAALAALGCPAIEVGIPFSDPIADGPVIAAAMHAALNPPAGSGVQPATPASVFAEVAGARAGTDAAIIAMVSYSIVMRMGEARFVHDAAAAGFDGFIVPDLPLEESANLRSLAAAAGRSLSLLVAPTTPDERARQIAQACTGFVYLLARTGITGAPVHAATTAAPAAGGAGAACDGSSQRTGSDLAHRVAALRCATSLPIACGFGISTKGDVRRVLAHADAAIVGSALVNAMGDAPARGVPPADAAASFVRELM